MANTIKTLADGDITRKALAIFHNKLKFLKTINRQYDDRFATVGAKNGGTLLIREPNQFTVRTGAVMDTQDVTESTQTLTLATQKGIDINFSSAELTLSLDDFSARILDPAMARLASDVESTVLNAVYKNIFNLSGTPATTPATVGAVLNAGVKLSRGLAPQTDRHLLFDSSAMAATVASVAAYFHKASELERAFADGYIGQAAGFKWWESEMTPNHTNGTRTDATPIVVDLSAVANGDTTLNTSGQTNAQTVKAGDIFTVAGVYAVNLETKQVYDHLQQFVITADKTCDATDVFAIAPTIYKSGAKQNVYHATWTGTPALVHVAAGGSGAASLVARQDLAYHKDAFTFVTADLEMPKGVDFAAREVYDGISMRVVRNYDIVNDKFPCRIDVLYGYKTIRPEWAVRVRG